MVVDFQVYTAAALRQALDEKRERRERAELVPFEFMGAQAFAIVTPHYIGNMHHVEFYAGDRFFFGYTSTGYKSHFFYGEEAATVDACIEELKASIAKDTGGALQAALF